MCSRVALALCAVMTACAVPRDRTGSEREIDASRYNRVPGLFFDYVISSDAHKNRAKLITKPRVDEPVAADNVVVESNVVRIVRPKKGDSVARQRRGYNLENVQVPARYPYLPVPRFYRFRRDG